jgi:hypothetical protein
VIALPRLWRPAELLDVSSRVLDADVEGVGERRVLERGADAADGAGDRVCEQADLPRDVTEVGLDDVEILAQLAEEPVLEDLGEFLPAILDGDDLRRDLLLDRAELRERGGGLIDGGSRATRPCPRLLECLLRRCDLLGCGSASGRVRDPRVADPIGAGLPSSSAFWRAFFRAPAIWLTRSPPRRGLG